MFRSNSQQQCMLRIASVALLCVFAMGATASAHTISIGFELLATPGDVNLWFGSYAHSSGSTAGNIFLEGSMNLVGIAGPGAGFDSTVAFDQLTAANAMPGGLIDGTNHFYVSTALNVDGPLVGSDTTFVTSICPLCGPVWNWQGVGFTGLADGTYEFTYIPIANPTLKWQPWNDTILTNTFTISGGGTVIIPPGGEVPEPGTLFLLGTGVFGLGLLRRFTG